VQLALGLAVVLLALLEIWQGWQLTPKQINREARRGGRGHR